MLGKYSVAEFLYIFLALESNIVITISNSICYCYFCYP